MRFHLFDKASGDWSHIEAYDLGGVRRDHLGDKHLMPLVPDYGKAAILLQDASYKEGILQAKIMNEKLDDVVVRLVMHIKWVPEIEGRNKTGLLHTESVFLSELDDRVAELRERYSKNSDIISFSVIMAGTEDRIFILNDERLDTKPKMPQYEKRSAQRKQLVSRKDLKKMAAGVKV